VRAEEVRRAAPDLIILDHWVHNHRRSQVAVECIRQHTDLAHIPIIIRTGFRNAPMALAAVLKEKNVTVLSKPFDIDALFPWSCCGLCRLKRNGPGVGARRLMGLRLIRANMLSRRIVAPATHFC